ncbi:PPOX class F420-dependent oxidoreductase [Patulibacter sp. SYSU D01012]|uniref:PPOX class F420-dependent oxidoreductase n=1 Tax=Patulibacter sp. SYSU D01012 TaxID=2817381 RepID=UPI001B30064D|nr:PPOX class F420-dependent oxidoreductase [Patulibacter sp. SYSU D01012]
MPTGSGLLAMGDQRYVSLTTFRRSGAPVATPVWVARHGDALVVTTPAGAGKVKRLRRDPRVELRPCGRTGTVAPEAPRATGRAEVLRGATATTGPEATLRRKYGWPFRLITVLGRVRRSGAERVILRITAG